MSEDLDYDLIFNTSMNAESGVVKSLCRYLMRYNLHATLAKVGEQEKQIADLRETIGGVEQQVHEICGAPQVQLEYLDDRITKLAARVGVEAARTNRSISDWAAAGWPGLVERAEKAEAEAEKLRTSVMYLRAILCRIAAEDYRGPQPSHIRLAREALKAGEES